MPLDTEDHQKLLNLNKNVNFDRKQYGLTFFQMIDIVILHGLADYFSEFSVENELKANSTPPERENELDFERLFQPPPPNSSQKKIKQNKNNNNIQNSKSSSNPTSNPITDSNANNHSNQNTNNTSNLTPNSTPMTYSNANNYSNRNSDQNSNVNDIEDINLTESSFRNETVLQKLITLLQANTSETQELYPSTIHQYQLQFINFEETFTQERFGSASLPEIVVVWNYRPEAFFGFAPPYVSNALVFTGAQFIKTHPSHPFARDPALARLLRSLKCVEIEQTLMHLITGHPLFVHHLWETGPHCFWTAAWAELQGLRDKFLNRLVFVKMMRFVESSLPFIAKGTRPRSASTRPPKRERAPLECALAYLEWSGRMVQQDSLADTFAPLSPTTRESVTRLRNLDEDALDPFLETLRQPHRELFQKKEQLSENYEDLVIFFQRFLSCQRLALLP